METDAGAESRLANPPFSLRKTLITPRQTAGFSRIPHPESSRIAPPPKPHPEHARPRSSKHLSPHT